eukprot:GHVH01001616.1.p1 GENE.GHVH01001616.1~~GHVH01001616.1.p1  ORF type:complete len:843 (+),score=117.31 GHVH01001616.1:65-2530(+)
MLAHFEPDNESSSNYDSGVGIQVDSDLFNRLDEVHQKVSHSLFDRCIGNKQIMDKIRKAIMDQVPHLEMEITDFDRLHPGIARLVLVQPAIYLPAINSVVRDLFHQVLSEFDDTEIVDNRLFRDPRLALKGWLRGNTVTPRGLKASRINTVVAVEGIVTRAGTAKHRILHSNYVAEKSLKKSKVDYHQDQFYKTPGIIVIPRKDHEGNHYHLETGLTEFKSYQIFTVQEMPENAPSGQLPCSVEVNISGYLVDNIKAGDRISVWGTYKTSIGKTPGGAKCWIEANNIEHLGGNKIPMQLDLKDEALIRKISKMPDILSHLAPSIAPTLYGGIEKKKGLLLQLAGGQPKSLENGTMRVRGDINILLIGDPSCGKSQMLRFMMKVSPLSISTTGRGSSGVGLTAAAKVDEENQGERVLEAGAMVMADGGLVCIDEFDKMSNDDRTAIHEVMEQQTVSISKASIQTTLNARCSVLAAANPTYGCFDDTKDIRSQICFPDSLLSRFDLIYLVHESSTTMEDRRICRTVLANHIHKASESSMVLSVGKSSGSNSAAGNQFCGVVNRTDWTILPRNDPTLSAENYDRKSPDGHVIYSIPFIKKYIQTAKQRTPELTDEAIMSISEYYTNMRSRFVKGRSGNHGRFAVPTPRTLEAAIRLATAHAKLSMKNFVDVQDVREAKKLLHFSLLGEEYESDQEAEVEMKPKKKVQKNVNNGAMENKKRPADDKVVEATAALAGKLGVKKAKKISPIGPEPTEVERTASLRAVAMIKDTEQEDTCTKAELLAKCIEQNDGRHIEPGVLDVLLSELALKNKLMLVEGTDTVWLI